MHTIDEKQSALDRITRSLLPQSRSPELRARARVLVLSLAVFTLAYVPSGLVALLRGDTTTGLVFCSVALANGAIWMALRLDLARLSHLMVALMLIEATVSNSLTGGLRGANVTTYFALMILPMYLLGKGGLRWVLLAILTPVTMALAELLGFRFPDAIPADEQRLDDFLSWITMALLSAALVWGYERERFAARLRRRDFLARVTHELRAPLQVITTTNALLAAHPVIERRLELLDLERQQVDGMRRLIDDLLGLTRDGTARFELDATPSWCGPRATTSRP